MTGPARITIELEPSASGDGRWATRTWVDEPLAAVLGEVMATEARETPVMPAAYEPPGDCTCLEGICDVDHAND